MLVNSFQQMNLGGGIKHQSTTVVSLEMIYKKYKGWSSLKYYDFLIIKK